MVKAVALLHFQRRNRTPEGVLIAELTDYKLAASLVSAPLAASRGDLGNATRQFFAVIRAKFGESEFDSNAASSAGKLGRSQSRQRLAELADAGLLEQTLEQKGNKAARWQTTGKDPESIGGGVPTYEVVCELVSARTHGRTT